MSGHSHWAGIKHKKGREDEKRGKVFSQLSKQISIAASSGDSAKLNMAIYKAKQANMPKENIERALSKGKLGGGKEVRYEVIGPFGSGLIIITKTDNKNRTVNEIKQVLKKHDAQIGSSAWMFDGTKPKYPLNIEDAQKEKILSLIKDLKNLDEVEEIWHNI